MLESGAEVYGASDSVAARGYVGQGLGLLPFFLETLSGTAQGPSALGDQVLLLTTKVGNRGATSLGNSQSFTWRPGLIKSGIQ